MATATQFRKLALALPEAEQKSHFGQPDFRVRNKIFAGLSPEGDRGTLKLTPELQAMVAAAKPSAFTPAPGAWGRSGWTYVQLAQVESGALKDLITEAFRLVAPKRLLPAAEGGAGGPAARAAKSPSRPRKRRAKPAARARSENR